MRCESRTSERGATLVVALPLIIVLLIVAVFVLTISFRARERTRLQVASDTTAQAAAGVMCSTKICWERVREVALEALRVNAKLDNTVEFSASDQNPDGSAQTEWDSSGYRIKLERGMWLPQGSFVSLEGDWQRNNPGKPVVALQNAVRIQVSRSILPFINIGLEGMLQASASSTALAQAVEEACVAPLAIPACALYDQNGELDQNQICLTDRIFTASNRYCPNGGDCGVLPDFNYEPLVEPISNAQTQLFQDVHVQSVASDTGNTDASCFFPSPRAAQISDHFGVVGIPGAAQANIELVRSALMQPHGCIQAAIGQRFSVLPQGLTSPEFGDLVWDQITNAARGGQEDRSHGAFLSLSAAAGFDGISDNQNRAFTDNSSRSTCEALAIGPPSDSPWGTRPTYGVCNSRRSNFGDWDNYNRRSLSIDNPFEPNACPTHDEQFNQQAWRVKIPVIASPEQNAASCAGTLESSSDPEILQSDNYEIVGFVSVVIFDVDIGALPPSLDNFSMGSEARGCSGIGEGMPGPHAPPPPPASQLFPFGFVGASGMPTPCNLVRARIDCNSKIFASKFDNQRNQPLIVE